MKSKKFTLHPERAQVKYFGVDFKETLIFAGMAINIDVVAIIEVKIDINILDRLKDSTPIDEFIFKKGTAIINADNLDEFNEVIICIKQKY